MLEVRCYFLRVYIGQQKTYWKCLSSFRYQWQNYCLSKEVELLGFFSFIVFLFLNCKRFKEFTNMFLLAVADSLVFSQDFHKEINSLISVIKVSRSTKSLSNLPFWMYCLKSRFFVLILDFMISFIDTGCLSSIVIYLLGT